MKNTKIKFECNHCFDEGYKINLDSIFGELITCSCISSKLKEFQKINFVFELYNSDIKELIDLSLVLKDKEMFIYYCNLLKEYK